MTFFNAIKSTTNQSLDILEGHRITVKRDDVVFIPAEAPHWYRAEGNEPFEFLCIVPNMSDKITIID